MADDTSTAVATELDDDRVTIERSDERDTAAAALTARPIASDATPASPPASPLDIDADEVFAANDHKVVAVPVDEWKKGAFIYIHTLSASDKDHLEQVLLAGTNDDGTRKRVGKDEVRAYFVAMCSRNSKGERIFGPDDVLKLKAKSVVPMDRLYDAVLNASVITEKDVEVMAKNSGAASNVSS